MLRWYKNPYDEIYLAVAGPFTYTLQYSGRGYTVSVEEEGCSQTHTIAKDFSSCLECVLVANRHWEYNNVKNKKTVAKDTDRKLITEEFEANTDRLYGPIDDAIVYLQEIRAQYPTANLYEDWWGYGDMDMKFTYTRKENDDEYAARMAELRRKEEAAERRRQLQREREQLNKANKIASLRRQLAELEGNGYS